MNLCQSYSISLADISYSYTYNDILYSQAIDSGCL